MNLVTEDCMAYLWTQRDAFAAEEVAMLSVDVHEHAGDEQIAYDKMKRRNFLDRLLTSTVSRCFEHEGVAIYRSVVILTKPAIKAWFEYIDEPLPLIFKYRLGE